jgi:hypothetical protein
MDDDYADFPCPPYMIYRGDCGRAWEQIGPANWRVRWKGNLECIARIAFRRFGPHLEHAVGAAAVRAGEFDGMKMRTSEFVEVTMVFQPPAFE